MFIVAFFDLDYLFKGSTGCFMWVNILLLVAVILVGQSSNNAVRWIASAPVRIQPSEFSKVIMIFCMANFIDKKEGFD